MKAGIDVGTTLTKAVWSKDGQRVYASTAERTWPDLLDQLRADGVTRVATVGIGADPTRRAGLDAFEAVPPLGEPIATEIRLQVDGARALLADDAPDVEAFLLVAIGSGTSYALVEGPRIKRFPYGNPIGGAFLRGLGLALGIDDHAELARAAAAGRSLDLRVEEVVPELKGTPTGDFVVADFVKSKLGSPRDDVAAGLVQCVATATLRDLLLIDAAEGFHVPQHVVVVGSTAAGTPALVDALRKGTEALGRHLHAPARGPFALALGAHLSPE